ncbi:MAG: hypothetical protein ACM3X1_08245, partial [Ignavibacteriales bacterium]
STRILRPGYREGNRIEHVAFIHFCAYYDPFTVDIVRIDLMVLLGERSKIGDQIVSQLILSDLRAPTGRQEDHLCIYFE